MALLTSSALTLTGGCMCSAIRYTIHLPALADRPLAPAALPTPINAAGETVETRFPLVDIDHCSDCRRACGGLVQCWFICPTSWVEFRLLPRNTQPPESAAAAASSTSGDTETHKGEMAGVKYSCDDVANPSPQTLVDTYLGHYESSPAIHRCFCTRCGTGVTYCSTRDRGPAWTLGRLVDVAVGSLDQESIESVRPDRHGWWEHGTGWVKELMEGGDGRWLIRHPTGRVSLRVEGGE